MSRFVSSAIVLVDHVLSLWFQSICLLCHHPVQMSLLCKDCRQSFHKINGHYCYQCGRQTSLPIRQCGQCTENLPPWETARSLLWLTDSSRTLLHFIKYGSRVECLNLFLSMIENADFYGYPSELAVIPVPMHWRRWLARGFNQSEILAHWISQKNGWSFCDHLKKMRHTPAQSSLRQKDRLNNLKHVFGWRGTIPPKNVLLVDDVFTTGNTLKRCTEALKSVGCEKVFVWTLLRVPPKKIPRVEGPEGREIHQS